MALGAAVGRIRIDTTDVERAEQRVRRSAAGIQRTFVGIKASAIDLNGVFGELGSAIGISLGIAGIVQLGRAFNELTTQAAQVERLRDNFDDLAQGVGQSGDAMLDAMRVASRGMVSDADLVLNANRALVTGVADSAQEIGQLLEIARVRGQALGISTQEAFTRLVQGIGKREKEILDELGIVLNLNDVYDEFAQKLGTTADALSEAQKTQAFFNAVVEDSADILKDVGDQAGNAADKIEKQKIAVDNLRQALGELFVEGQTTSAGFWTTMIDGLTQYVKALQQIQNQGFGFVPRATFPNAPPGLGGPPAPSVRRGVAGPRFTPEQEELIIQRDADLRGLEADSQKARVEAETDYLESVADVERDHQQRMLREGEDFASSRQRQEQDFQAGILEIRREGAQREEKAAADLARTLNRARADSEERIAEAREDTNERLAELDEDFQRAQARRQQEFEDDMLSAAGRLDAIALLELRKDRARQLKDAEEAHEEQRDDLQKQLQERIDDENEALAKIIAQANEARARQLEDGRKADEQRIIDMQADFAERKRREDEDRVIRLTRLADDHQARLDEMARQHQLDLDQIGIHEQEKRDKIEEEFNKESKLNDAWIKENKRVADNAILDFTRAMDNIALRAAGLLGLTAMTGGSRGHPSTADPYVDRPMVPGSSIAYTPPYNPRGGWEASRTVNIQPGGIVINGDGLNEQEVVEILVNRLEEWAR